MVLYGTQVGSMKERSFSVVITTYNRKKKLKAALSAILSQDYPKDKYEVIVSDDGSTDGTEEEVKSFMLKNKTNLFYIRNPHKGVVSAVNAGAKLASKEILVLMLADDNITESNFLKECNEWFNKHPGIDVIAAMQKPKQELVDSNIFAKYEWFMTQYYVNNGGVGPPFALKREIFLGIGGLDKNIKYSEDVNLCDKLTRKGYKITNTPIIVTHNRGYTLKEFLKQTKARGIAGREYVGRMHFIVKFFGFPFIMLWYWYQFYKYGKVGAIDMWIMHCAFNFMSSIYGIIG